MSPVDLYIPLYPETYLGDEQELRARLRRASPRGKTYVALSYAFVVAMNFLWIFYVLIPFFLSGYAQLSIERIERSDLALWDYTAYPLYAYTPEIALFVFALSLFRSCLGFVVFLGLLVELIYKWPAYSWRANAVKLACLLFVVIAYAMGWQVSHHIDVLLWD